MSSRRSLKLPIVLGVVMITLLVVMTVGWVILSLINALADAEYAGVYWTIMSIGTLLLVLVLAGVVTYLALSIKAINLTRRQSNFIDSVTHELKSPIASLKLYLQTLHRRDVSQQQRESFYQFMLEDVERLDQLINHMLEAGRIDKPVMEDEVEAIALDGVLRDCAETLCARYQVPLHVVRLDAAPCSVLAPRVDLEIIVRNVLDNAIKYAGREPRVMVTVNRASEGMLVVRISDNGRGIPKHLRRKIFGRFVRLGLELERETPGTGLGLYIVRTLVRKLGGAIRVRDAAGNSGTTFEIYLPGRLTREVPSLPDDAETAASVPAR